MTKSACIQYYQIGLHARDIFQCLYRTAGIEQTSLRLLSIASRVLDGGGLTG